MVAWFAAKQLDAVNQIVRHGSVTFRSGRAAPPLTAAVDLGLLPLVKSVLEFGVDINAVDSEGTTALMHVTGDWDTRSCDDDSDVRRPTIALAELLLQHNADVTTQDSRGRTALHHFAASKCAFLDTAARHFVCLRLIRAGLLPLSRDNASWCAFDCAADRKDTFLVKAMAAENTWLRRRDAMLLWVAHTPLRAKAVTQISSVK
jgi:ankyrin repeat protein